MIQVSAVNWRGALLKRPYAILYGRATIARAVESIDEAGSYGARMITFHETYTPGYPEWIWRLRPGTDYQLTAEIYAELVRQAVDLSTDQLDPILDAARRHGATVVVGLQERDASFSRGTLYNTVVVVSAGGGIVNRHRKFMPPHPERM